MARIENILAAMKQNSKGIRFRDLCKVCDFTLVKLGSKAAATVFTRHPGKEIRESISKTTREKQKRTK